MQWILLTMAALLQVGFYYFGEDRGGSDNV